MVSVNKYDDNQPAKRGAPARTAEHRERQMIGLAVDLVEQRLRDGTASSAETTHYLKLASTSSEQAIENMKLTNELLRVKAESMASSARVEALYTEAIKAFREYQGEEIIELE